MPVRTAGALVFLLLMIEQHNTFSFWNGYQINPKICQNILYSHCFMSQNTCFSFLNSGTAHHFLFLPKEQHTTFSFCQNHGWSILNQSFARFMMGSNYVDPKTVLDNVKSTTWKFFKFRMEGGEVDKNYVFCRLCLDGGNEGKRGQIKYCGGTTIYYIAYKWIHISPFRIYNLWKITIWVYIWLFGKNQWLIGYQISLIVIARQPKYHRFYALVSISVAWIHLYVGVASTWG